MSIYFSVNVICFFCWKVFISNRPLSSNDNNCNYNIVQSSNKIIESCRIKPMKGIKTFKGWEVLSGIAPRGVDRKKSVLIGTSIWCYVYGINNIQGYLLEYDNRSDKLLSIIYDQYSQMDNDACCGHQKNIYFVKSMKTPVNNGRITVFNTLTKAITNVIYINTMGFEQVLSCIAMNDVIHIFNGSKLWNHFTYSINTNTVTTLTDPVNEYSFINASKYQNTLLKFNGPQYYIKSNVLALVYKGLHTFDYKCSTRKFQEFGCIFIKGYVMKFVENLQNIKEGEIEDLFIHQIVYLYSICMMIKVGGNYSI